MRCLVSACLLGEKCRYNGSDALSERVLRYVKNKKVISFCPELLAGLKTPREPAEIVNGKGTLKVFTKSGIDVTNYFEKGAEISLEIAKSENIKLAILKSDSPSCGVNRIYSGKFNGVKVPGSGLTAQLLINKGVKVLTEKDI